jgi:hypothetical protein
MSEKERIRELIYVHLQRIKAPPTKSAKNDALSPTRIHTHMDKYLQVEASIDRVANLGTRTLVGRVANVNDGTKRTTEKGRTMVPTTSDHARGPEKDRRPLALTRHMREVAAALIPME